MSTQFHPTDDRLEAFVEGTLQDGDRVVIESHLVGCQTCQTEVEEWRNLFAALSGLPQFEPSLHFADRVMARVRIPAASTSSSWQQAWQQYAGRNAWRGYAGRAGDVLSRVTPHTTLGLSLAAACLGLPIVLIVGLVAWVLQQAALTPREGLSYVSTWLVEGVQGAGSTAFQALVQTDVAVWAMSQFASIVESGGLTGIGTALGVLGVSGILSVWVLYRNLFRSPTRESNHVTYCF